ncbi:metallophosphoesterase family protein [Vagococcus bubulae]|uniref:Serine/threonine protein phosphatase n=1 Tax=Vagococcus bubulae TaxID=1977868 RepID=A0A429ZL37_9ENTE|nr:metallophosphoesterase [Vagococcus bubulae]RST94391.1 serine/threonine protein phosphatase [Vagococcus bubulae]
MRTILVGDLHLTAQIILPMAEKKLKEFNCEQLILLGDYTDAYNQTENIKLYMDELAYLLDFKKRLGNNGVEVIMLLGNHDSDYLISSPKIYSLKNPDYFMKIREQLMKLGLQVSYELGNYLVSHAGYTEDYRLEAWHLEKISKKSIEKVAWLSNHVGIYRGGKYISGSPLWADFEELTRFPNLDYPKQIVGHTPQKNVNIVKNSKIEIVGIDTFTVTPLNQKPYYEQLGSGEILLYENNKLERLSLSWRNEDIIKMIDSKFDRILDN